MKNYFETYFQKTAENLVMAHSSSFVFTAVSEFCITLFIFRHLMIIFNVHRSPLAQMEEERREHVAKMKKMEMEMEQVFEMKVFFFLP